MEIELILKNVMVVIWRTKTVNEVQINSLKHCITPSSNNFKLGLINTSQLHMQMCLPTATIWTKIQPLACGCIICELGSSHLATQKRELQNERLCFIRTSHYRTSLHLTIFVKPCSTEIHIQLYKWLPISLGFEIKVPNLSHGVGCQEASLLAFLWTYVE